MGDDGSEAGEASPCIVCGAKGTGYFMEAGPSVYFRCGICNATFLNPGQRLSRVEESDYYRLHRNQ